MLLYVVLTVVLLLLIVWMRQPKRLTLPGPRGLPILGNLLQLDLHRPHERLSQWAEKYGEVYGLNLMGVNWVVVSGYDAMHEVLIQRGPDFHNRPRGIWRSAYVSFGNSNLFWSHADDPYYVFARRNMHKTLKQYSVGIDRIEQVVSTMLEDLVNNLKETNGQPLNPMNEVYNFAIKSLLYFSLDRYIADEKDPIFQEFRDLERAYVLGLTMTGKGSELDAFPWLRHFGNVAYTHLANGRRLARELWDNRLKKEIQSEIDPNDPRGLMHGMLLGQQTERDAEGKLFITDANVRMHLVDVMAAGTTTTGNTLGAFFSILVNYPQVQAKLQAEVERVAGDRGVTVKDRDDMPYTRAVVYELNRFVSVVPLGVPHAAAKDVMLAGSLIPKGTVILANTWGLHHDETFWGDPWCFRPERFLNEQGNVVPADHDNRKHLLPFGAGSRVCVGEVFAMTRMFIFVATVMQKFNVEPVPGQTVDCDPRKYVLGITLAPQPFQVKVVPRE